MRTSKPIAAVDADGVILNFLHQWEVAAFQALKRKIVQVSGDYDLHIRYATTQAETKKIWEEFYNHNHWRKIPEIEGAVSGVNKLISEGYEVHVVTAIPSHLLYERLINLHKIGMPLLKVHCTQHKKADKLKELNPVVYFDDNPFHIREAKEIGVPHRIIIPVRSEDHEEPAATMSATSLIDAVDRYLHLHHRPAITSQSRISM